MLTPDDNETEGQKISYLLQPKKWRHYDPVLFDSLKDILFSQPERNVRMAEQHNILSGAKYFTELLPEVAVRRERYFATFIEFAQGCDLVFFDPDIGIEVKSIPRGRKGSSKYVYWSELIATFAAGHSILVYQHFPRKPRDQFVQSTVKEISEKTGARNLYTFSTSHVLFLLAVQAAHEEFFQERGQNVIKVWGEVIKVSHHKVNEI